MCNSSQFDIKHVVVVINLTLCRHSSHVGSADPFEHSKLVGNALVEMLSLSGEIGFCSGCWGLGGVSISRLSTGTPSFRSRLTSPYNVSN